MIPRSGLWLVHSPSTRRPWLVERGHVTWILASRWSRPPDRGLIGSRRASSAESLYGAVIWRHNAPWARPGLVAADIARCFLDWGRRGWSGPAVTRCLHISLDSEAQTRGERAPLIITSVSLSQTRALGILWDQTRAITHGNKHSVIFYSKRKHTFYHCGSSDTLWRWWTDHLCHN